MVRDPQLWREQEVREPLSVSGVLENSRHAVELDGPRLHEVVDGCAGLQVDVAGLDAGEVGRRQPVLDANEGEPVEL